MPRLSTPALLITALEETKRVVPGRTLAAPVTFRTVVCRLPLPTFSRPPALIVVPPVPETARPTPAPRLVVPEMPSVCRLPLTGLASATVLPAAMFNPADPLRAMPLLTFSSPPPPATFNVLASERLPPRFTVLPVRFKADGAVTLTGLL